MTTSVPQTNTASLQHHYEVTRSNLPISCPMPDMRLWDAHPRVYLPIQKTGQATCPYCGARYTLVDSASSK